MLTLLVPEPHTVPTYQETLLVFDASASFLRTTVVGPGEYVYEPSGNVDWRRVVGDEPLPALIVVMGTVEFLNADGSVRSRANAASQRAELERYCQMQRVARPYLVG
jgi:hypothetical protein